MCVFVDTSQGPRPRVDTELKVKAAGVTGDQFENVQLTITRRYDVKSRLVRGELSCRYRTQGESILRRQQQRAVDLDQRRYHQHQSP